MSINFTEPNDNDDFQEFLSKLPGLTPMTPGKRGSTRSVTNNIGAEVLSFDMLTKLRKNHHVDVSQRENLVPHTLWGVIDKKSFTRADDANQGIPADENYSQSGVLAVSLARSQDKATIFLQWWKGTIVNGVLTFKKVSFKGKKYRLTKDSKGNIGFFKFDEDGNPVLRNKAGDYAFFPYNELVNFEEYLNAIVMETETPVSFPESEVSNLQGLSEILAKVNIDSNVSTLEEFEEESSEIEDSDSDFDEDEVEE